MGIYFPFLTIIKERISLKLLLLIRYPIILIQILLCIDTADLWFCCVITEQFIIFEIHSFTVRKLHRSGCHNVFHRRQRWQQRTDQEDTIKVSTNCVRSYKSWIIREYFSVYLTLSHIFTFYCVFLLSSWKCFYFAGIGIVSWNDSVLKNKYRKVGILKYILI